MEYIEYSTEDYPFRKIIEEVLQTKDLERIHSMADYELFVKGTDQSTIWHKRYYDNLLLNLLPFVYIITRFFY